MSQFDRNLEMLLESGFDVFVAVALSTCLDCVMMRPLTPHFFCDGILRHVIERNPSAGASEICLGHSS